MSWKILSILKNASHKKEKKKKKVPQMPFAKVGIFHLWKPKQWNNYIDKVMIMTTVTPDTLGIYICQAIF